MGPLPKRCHVDRPISFNLIPPCVNTFVDSSILARYANIVSFVGVTCCAGSGLSDEVEDEGLCLGFFRFLSYVRCFLVVTHFKSCKTN